MDVAGVAGKVDENVDFVAANQILDLRVRPLVDHSPAIRQCFQTRGNFVGFERGGVAGDFKFASMVMGEDGFEEEMNRMIKEVARDIADAEWAVRVGAVGMRGKAPVRVKNGS